MILSFDIGGTKIAGAIFDNSEEKARVIEPMPQTGYSDFLAALDRIIEKLTAKYPNIIKFGAGFCGAYDVKRDLITSAGNVPYCVGHNLKKDIEELLEKRNIDCPVDVDNDANCAALAEALEGAGKDYNSVLLLILGTGAGSGLVINKQLVSGSNGLTGELARVTFPIYDEEDLELVTRFFKEKRRPYGKPNGDIEQFISGKGLKQLYEWRTGKTLEAKEIGELYNNKDAEAVKVMDEYFERVAKAAAVIVNMIDPEAIILSGGVSSVTGICEEVQNRMKKYTIINDPNTRILQAEFGVMAGLRGAALLVNE